MAPACQREVPRANIIADPRGELHFVCAARVSAWGRWSWRTRAARGDCRQRGGVAFLAPRTSKASALLRFLCATAAGLESSFDQRHVRISPCTCTFV